MTSQLKIWILLGALSGFTWGCSAVRDAINDPEIQPQLEEIGAVVEAIARTEIDRATTGTPWEAYGLGGAGIALLGAIWTLIRGNKDAVRVAKEVRRAVNESGTETS